MPEDTYAGFAERYDLFFARWGEHDPVVATFFRQLFEEHQVHSVLDCSCGTGADLALFHDLGCDVTGSDISAAMLAQARRNLEGRGLTLPLIQADYRELPQRFTQPFDAVVCLSSSLLHMSDEREMLRALHSMSAVLRPSGILVITQGTSDRQWSEKPRFILAVNNTDFTRLFVIDYHGLGARYNILDIWHSRERSELQSWGNDYAYVLLQQDYQRLLPQAGLQPNFYGTYRRDPYDREISTRLIVVAHKERQH